MSVWAVPMIAAKRAVAPPTSATTAIAAGERRKNTLARATTYTPAVTIVAAWIRAETGVGPAIASGSQTYRGSWALLPAAPTKRQSAIAVIAGAKRAGEEAAAEKIRSKSSVPKSPRIR